MIEPGAKVLDVGCGDGELLRLLGETRGVDGRGIELSREGRERKRGRRVWRWCRRRRYRSLATIPTTLSITSSCRRRCRPRASARGAGAHAAHRAPRGGVVPEFRPLAHPAADHVRRSHAPHRQPVPIAGTTRPISISAPSRTSANCASESGAKMEKAVALNAWGRRLRLNAPWWFWNLFGEQAVFLLSRKAERGPSLKLKTTRVALVLARRDLLRCSNTVLSRYSLSRKLSY